MRIEASVTSITWIPSEAIQGVKYLKVSFDMGVTHYDPPPPDEVDDLPALRTPAGSALPTSSRRGSR